MHLSRSHERHERVLDLNRSLPSEDQFYPVRYSSLGYLFQHAWRHWEPHPHLCRIRKLFVLWSEHRKVSYPLPLARFDKVKAFLQRSRLCRAAFASSRRSSSTSHDRFRLVDAGTGGMTLSLPTFNSERDGASLARVPGGSTKSSLTSSVELLG